jgi:hypothetical protein
VDMLMASACDAVIDGICGLNWEGLGRDELIGAAWAYYHFSIQFRRNLKFARHLHPGDPKLQLLEAEECATANLSPWPDVAAPDERMNHDEFIRRLLLLSPPEAGERARLEQIGRAYLAEIAEMAPQARAMSIASYEDGGLGRVFRAILRARDWDAPALRAFRHFLRSHIGFDSDPLAGHGALTRHLAPDHRVLPLWAAFRHLLVASVPRLDRR